MDLKRYFYNLKPEEKRDLAAVCGTSTEYLYQIAGGHRLPGFKLAQRIEQATKGAIPKNVLRPDIWPAGKVA